MSTAMPYDAHGHTLVAQWNAGTAQTDLLLRRPDGSVVPVASLSTDTEVYALADRLREQYPGLAVDVRPGAGRRAQA